MDELPPWLRATTPASPHYERTRRYFRALFNATPKWLTYEQRQAFYRVYRDMREQRFRGRNVNVDHIVPICHKYVCGLNAPWNLRVVVARENMSKGNRWWPDCPWQNKALDLPAAAPHQTRLPL